MRFGHIYWRNPLWKTSFLCSVFILYVIFYKACRDQQLAKARIPRNFINSWADAKLVMHGPVMRKKFIASTFLQLVRIGENMGQNNLYLD